MFILRAVSALLERMCFFVVADLWFRCIKIWCKFHGKIPLGGPVGPPLCTNGSQKYVCVHN